MFFFSLSRIYRHKLTTLKFAVTSGNLDDGNVCPACPKVCTVQNFRGAQ